MRQGEEKSTDGGSRVALRVWATLVGLGWRVPAGFAKVVGIAGLVALMSGLFLAWTVPLPARLQILPSTVITFSDGSPAHVFLSPDEKFRMAVTATDLDSIDSEYLDALVRFEDKRFYRHPGVDMLAVLRSVVVNLRFGRVASGASTITMQLVRLLEPRPRHLGSKGMEALRALQFEIRFSKREILAAYLSFLPFGRNVEGLPAACWSYFGHSPQELTAVDVECHLVGVVLELFGCVSHVDANTSARWRQRIPDF